MSDEVEFDTVSLAKMAKLFHCGASPVALTAGLALVLLGGPIERSGRVDDSHYTVLFALNRPNLRDGLTAFWSISAWNSNETVARPAFVNLIVGLPPS